MNGEEYVERGRKKERRWQIAFSRFILAVREDESKDYVGGDMKRCRKGEYGGRN